jgi:hypothetical protein
MPVLTLRAYSRTHPALTIRSSASATYSSGVFDSSCIHRDYCNNSLKTTTAIEEELARDFYLQRPVFDLDKNDRIKLRPDSDEYDEDAE